MKTTTCPICQKVCNTKGFHMHMRAHEKGATVASNPLVRWENLSSNIDQALTELRNERARLIDAQKQIDTILNQFGTFTLPKADHLQSII